MDTSRALPTGIVTFLLTDIQGSTRLWEAEPRAMRDALVRHDAIMLAVVRRLNGRVVKSKGEGDSVFAVFHHARDAVTAALVLQVTLANEKWPTTRPISVRMAIHTGQVELIDGDYYGTTVNRCARLRAVAKGGQVLLSSVTAKLIDGQLPTGATLKDLGSQQLKDLSTPERVWQLLHPRLPSEGDLRVPAPVEQPQAPAVSAAKGYVLTDQLNHDAKGREWCEKMTHIAPEVTATGEDARIRCYASPTVAALMNPAEAGFRLPRVWEARIYPAVAPGEALLSCHQVTTSRTVPIPAVTGLQHARFAVLAAREACAGTYAEDFTEWAACWLGGEDRSGTAAFDLADRIERVARPDEAALTRHDWLMLANAARAAAHGTKLSWLVGRARDEENKMATALAGEAVRMALRMERLDVLALAEQAMPRDVAPVLPIRSAAA